MKKDKSKSHDRHAGFLLWQAGNAWQRQIRTALTPVGLTHVQYLLLETLEELSAESGGTSQVKLAKAAGIDVMMTSKVLRLLVRKKLIARKAARSDARAFYAELTKEGIAVLGKSRKLIAKNEDEFFGKLEKRKKFIENLKMLVE
jgi:DNA-binding MarR family transcriptional regulator